MNINSKVIGLILKQSGVNLKTFRLSEDKKYKIVEMYNTGLSQTEVAKQLKVSEIAVNLILHERGVLRTRRLTKKDEDRIVELYTNGLSITKISDELGFSQRTINKIFKKRGVKTRSNKKLTESDEDVIISLYNEGYSMNRLSKLVGYSVMTIRSVLIRNNVEIRKKSEAVSKAKKTDENIQKQIVHLYKTGLTQREVSEEVKVSEITVRKILHEHGVNRKNRF